MISNCKAEHVSLIRRVTIAGARAIFPVYPSTPSSGAFRESGLLPHETEFEKKAGKVALHAHRLDPLCPFKKELFGLENTIEFISPRQKGS